MHPSLAAELSPIRPARPAGFQTRQPALCRRHLRFQSWTSGYAVSVLEKNQFDSIGDPPWPIERRPANRAKPSPMVTPTRRSLQSLEQPGLRAEDSPAPFSTTSSLSSDYVR